MGKKQWNILSWNIRGINSDKKWNAIYDRLCNNNCDVLCLQETKREHFDTAYIRKFAPRRFDKFDYIPSEGASGGILVI